MVNFHTPRPEGYGSASTRNLQKALRKSSDFKSFKALQQKAASSSRDSFVPEESAASEHLSPGESRISPPSSSSSNHSFRNSRHRRNSKNKKSQEENNSSQKNLKDQPTTAKQRRAVQIRMPDTKPQKSTSTGTKTTKASTVGFDSNATLDFTHASTERYEEDGIELRDSNDDVGDGDDRPNNNNNKKNESSSSAPKKPDTLNEQFQSLRMTVGLWINQPHIQMIVIFLIIVNALLMGIATFDFVSEDETRNHRFEVTDEAFLVLFTIELGMQLLYHGLALFTDGWLLFDFIIIVTSWSFSSFQVIRTFRIFRALRLVSRLKVLRNLVDSIFKVMPSLFAIVWLLLLVMYIYGVMCTVLFSDLYERGITDDNYFGRLDITLFYLFQMMTLDFAEIVRQVMKEYYWSRYIFTSFLCISSFILYSLIIAVICDAVAVTEHEEDNEREAEKKEQTRQHIQHLEQRLHAMTKQQMDLYRTLQITLAKLESSAPRNKDDKDNNHPYDEQQESENSLNVWEVAVGSPRGGSPTERLVAEISEISQQSNSNLHTGTW